MALTKIKNTSLEDADLVALAGNDGGALTGVVKPSNDLSDLLSASTAIANLGITSTAAELNKLDGVTSSTAELNIMTGVIATATELNLLDGVNATLTSGELNLLDGITSIAALSGNTFTGAQIGTVTALTSASAAMAINLASNNNFSHTTSENTTLSAPSNPVAGQSGVITITQGATARTLAYNTFWKFAGGTVPDLTATVGAVDVFVYNVESATRATAQLIGDVK